MDVPTEYTCSHFFIDPYLVSLTLETVDTLLNAALTVNEPKAFIEAAQRCYANLYSRSRDNELFAEPFIDKK